MKDKMYKCKRCKGKGKVDWNTTDILISNSHMVKCPDCLGEGKLDWIANVTGEKNRSYTRAFYPEIYKD